LRFACMLSTAGLGKVASAVCAHAEVMSKVAIAQPTELSMETDVSWKVMDTYTIIRSWRCY